MTPPDTDPYDRLDFEQQPQARAPADTPVRALDMLLVILLTVVAIFSVGWLVGDLGVTLEHAPLILVLLSAIPLAAVYLVVVRGRGIVRNEIGLRSAPRRWYFWAVLIALLAVPTISGVNGLVQSLTGRPFYNPQVEVLAPIGFSWRAFLAMLLAAGVVAPVAEEVVFRGLLYGWLRGRLGVAASVAVSATVFSLAHGIAILIPALAVHGAILAFVYERSRSLWPSIVLHGTFNAIMVSALYVSLASGVAQQ